MSFEAWQEATAAKTHTSWNLHTLLPNLSFFILLSSISGIIGNPGQANYAAGNTYQDALAIYRNACGQHVVALDLGWLASIGAVAESTRLQKGVSSRKDLIPIPESDLLALLEHYCSSHFALHSGTTLRPVIGLATPAATDSDLPHFFSTPPYRILRQATRLIEKSTEAAGKMDYKLSFAGCETLSDAEDLVVRGLVGKLAAALGMPAEDVDTGKPLHAYGVDFLLAVELRNWFGKEIGANVAIFDIMGGQSIADVTAMVVERSRWRKKEWE